MNAPIISLADGNKIPALGLGTWQVTSRSAYDASFVAAIEAGYRHFDTAQAYRNEQMLGENWVNSGIKRQDLFITTKILVTNFTRGRLRSSFEESLKKLRTDYVDLLLLHFPVPVLRNRAWHELEALKDQGLAKSIGVSNFTLRHLKQLEAHAKQAPVINQVELNVFLQQPELIDYCHQNKIQVEAYSPLARAHIMDNPVVSQLATTYNKSYAQIMLRFLIERGLVVIPKSASPKRLKENINIFDFKLSSNDMKRLSDQDQNKRFCWSPVHVP
jgi:diketogulonate reductase-like aldo/keto reductase